jgi:hypothetical protein
VNSPIFIDPPLKHEAWRVGRYLINFCESTIVGVRRDVANVDSDFLCNAKKIGESRNGLYSPFESNWG